MRTIFLLCAAFALSIATEPVEEVAAAPEIHLDEGRPLRMLDRAGEEQLPGEEGEEQMLVDVEKSSGQYWQTYGSRSFFYSARKMRWADAEKFCLRSGANLASIHSMQEYSYVQELIHGSTGEHPRTWIGANDAVQYNEWLWSDGSMFSFSIWNDESQNKGGNCVVMNQPVYNLWWGANCEVELPFVCGTRPADK